MSDDNSGVSRWQRLRSYIYKPWNGFSSTSIAERRADAWLVFGLYFVLTLPHVVNKMLAQGKLQQFELGTGIIVVAAGVAAGIVMTVIIGLVLAGGLSILINGIMRKTITYGELLRMLGLSLSPYLITVWELPSLFLNFGEYKAFTLMLMVRLVALIMCLRTFYWGLRMLADLRKGAALAIVLAPAALLLLLVALAVAAKAAA